MRDQQFSHFGESFEDLPALPYPQSPGTAFGVGLVFGPLGLAIHLRSVRAFCVCLAVFVGASLILPGIGMLFGWCFSPLYGAWRVHSSNQNLGL